METEGKLIQVLPVQNITSQKGQMKKMEFVIETEAKFPKKICFSIWNDKIDLFTSKPGDNIKVYFDLDSREYNGRWYTEARAWKVEAAAAGTTDIPATIKDEIPATFSQKEEIDDLPF
jgi:hypothetical protein